MRDLIRKNGDCLPENQIKESQVASAVRSIWQDSRWTENQSGGESLFFGTLGVLT
jgi:hypothetical protein